MKKTTFIFLLFSFIFIKSYAQTKSITSNSSQIEDTEFKYKRVQISKSSPDVIKKLMETGVDLDCGIVNTATYIQLELSDYELGKIKSAGLKYKVVIEDLTKLYSERAQKDMPQAQSNLLREKKSSKTNKSLSIKNVIIGNIGQQNDCSEINFVTPTNFTIPSTFGGCLTNNGMIAELDKMQQMYPNLISVKANISPSNQLTHQGRPIYYVKISDNPSVNETEPNVLYTGMTHSREVSSMMNTIYYMWYLLENYYSDPFIKSIVDNTEMYFVPVANPDGLSWNETIAPTGGGMQRKNLRPGICDAGTTASSNNTRGVDLNRNYGYYYGLVGSSTVLCDNTYRGTAAFSEPETQMMRDFVLTKNFKTALNHHAYSNLLPHPINGKSGVLTGRENEFAKLSHDMTQYNRYVYGPAPGILYAASGDASDWMTGGVNDGTGSTGSGKNTLSLSPENGSLAEGGFWPSPINITAIAKRALRMNLIAAYYAGKYAKFHDLTQSSITSLNSNLTFGIERLGQTTANYTLTVTPVSSNIVSITSPTVQTGMTVLEQRNVTAAIQLAPGILPNQKIEYKISLSNGDYILYEANFIKYYQPTVLFSDNPDANLLSKWTQAGGTWVNSTSAYSGTRSITDASTVAYANNLNKTLTTATTSNLSGATKVLVQYYAKWDLERNFDLVQMQGSTNGTNWTPLCGTYTKPTSTTETNPHATKSSTNNFQNTAGAGGVLYDGNQMGKWVMEEIVIDASNNSFLVGATAARFRLYMRSDSSNNTDGYTTTFDGFYIDDFKVIKILDLSAAPVAICKDATLSLSSSGQLTVLPTDINNGSTDDVAITSISVSPNTFNCTHRNTTQLVTLTVTDADGQTSSCTSSVTIKDTTAPIIPTLATVMSQNAVTLTAPTTTDICAGTIIGTTDATFPITAQGTTVVVWTFDDGSGQSVTANQNVIIDNTAPTAPTELIASGTTQTSTNLSWTASSDDTTVTGYDVYQGSTLRASVTTTSYAVTGLTASTAYTFSVKAKDAVENISAESIMVNVTTLDPIVDTTAPSAPASLVASGTTQTTTNLSWTASADDTAVTGYDVYQETTLMASVTATSYTVTGLTASTAYAFSIRAKDAAGNISVSSNVASVTTSASIAAYCVSKGNSVTKEKIGKVVFGTINNTTTGGTGYENYTAIATNATRGTSYTITITPSWASTKYKEGYSVWIDYNGDGDFVDAGEQVFTRAATTTTPVTGSITVPATAKVGATRMRVSMKYNAIPASCETFASGQVEDYTVNITAPAARTNETSKQKEITNDIVVYPNPTTLFLHINSVSEDAAYKIYDLIGQTIMKGKLSNNSINVSSIAEGNYLLEITDKETTTIKRFIKQ
ncbi:M14 family zinc carboxypeptidase [Flavobacterium yafengii]|uniref:M14 family zinc carboxypeptidase n=1 Tax=Flavobacterium yafengii TaxID=3041253 RepID=UPI0024A7DA2B|nr:M14 family zinc carboxypeptidase [Flavobacterium yafengii]MDI5887259.1 M14 family zinc carboxypeptidase [Flavobacterium yafengii]